MNDSGKQRVFDIRVRLTMEYSTAIRCSTEYGAQTLAADEFIDIVEAMLTPNDLFNLLRNSTTEIISVEARG